MNFDYEYVHLVIYFQLSHEDQRLLLSSSEWVEDVKDSDPYVSVISRLSKRKFFRETKSSEFISHFFVALLGEAIQDSETLVEFVKKSFSIIINTCNV